MADVTHSTDANGNTVLDVDMQDDTQLTLATAGTYVDKNIVVNTNYEKPVDFTDPEIDDLWDVQVETDPTKIYLTQDDVVNNVTTSSSIKPLSAYQGQILQNQIDDIENHYVTFQSPYRNWDGILNHGFQWNLGDSEDGFDSYPRCGLRNFNARPNTCLTLYGFRADSTTRSEVTLVDKNGDVRVLTKDNFLEVITYKDLIEAFNNSAYYNVAWSTSTPYGAMLNTSYPTNAGLFRTNGTLTPGLPTGAGVYGSLAIFNCGSYRMHIYMDNAQGIYMARTTNAAAPTTWNKLTTTSIAAKS